MPYGYYNPPAADPPPVIPVAVTPSAGLTDSDLAVGLRVGKVAINSNPADHSTVQILSHTFEFVRVGDTVETEDAVAVQRGVGPDEAVKATGQIHLSDIPANGDTVAFGGATFEFVSPVKATGRLIVANTPTGAAGFLHIGNSPYKYYALAATDPQYVDYYWIEWPSETPYTSSQGATAIAAAINSNDGTNYTATPGGPDENGCYYVDIVAVKGGAAWNATAYITSSDLSGGDLSDGLGDALPGNVPVEIDWMGLPLLGTQANLIAAANQDYCTVTATQQEAPSTLVDLEAKVGGTGNNETIAVTGTAVVVDAHMTGGEDAYAADSNATVAMALATAISNATPPEIEAAIDPAHTSEVILISLE